MPTSKVRIVYEIEIDPETLSHVPFDEVEDDDLLYEALVRIENRQIPYRAIAEASVDGRKIPW